MVLLEDRNITLSSKNESISHIEGYVSDFCSDLEISEDYYGNILVAVTEAVTNAIQHGNRYDSNKNVTLNFSSKENKVTISVTDEGKGFDYNNIPDPTSPENIEKPNGRGVFLMKSLSDEVAFEDKGRKVILKFNI